MRRFLILWVAAIGCTAPNNVQLTPASPDAAPAVVVLRAPDAAGAPPPAVDGGGGGGGAVKDGPVPDAATVADAPRADGPVQPDAPPGPMACSPDQHLCGGRCESETITSCGPSCLPCPHPANALATCESSKCVLACAPGFGSCGGTMECATHLNSDPGNCGRCNRSCEAGKPCQNGTCAPVKVASGLVYNEQTSGGNVFDGSDLYYSNSGLPAQDGIFAISHNGGTPRTVRPNNSPYSMNLLGRTLIWTEPAVQFQYTTYAIVQMPAGGGSPQRVAVVAAPPPTTFQMIGSDLYWWRFTSDQFTAFAIERAALGGGTPVTVGTGMASITNFLADASGVYWMDHNPDGTIHFRAPGGGAESAFEATATEKSLLALDADYLYWIDDAAIVRRRKDGSGATETLASTATIPPFGKSGEVNGDDLFLFIFGEAVVQLPRSGGTPLILVPPDPDKRFQLGHGIDDRYVYWLGKGGALWRVPR